MATPDASAAGQGVEGEQVVVCGYRLDPETSKKVSEIHAKLPHVSKDVVEQYVAAAVEASVANVGAKGMPLTASAAVAATVPKTTNSTLRQLVGVAVEAILFQRLFATRREVPPPPQQQEQQQ